VTRRYSPVHPHRFAWTVGTLSMSPIWLTLGCSATPPEGVAWFLPFAMMRAPLRRIYGRSEPVLREMTPPATVARSLMVSPAYPLSFADCRVCRSHLALGYRRITPPTEWLAHRLKPFRSEILVSQANSTGFSQAHLKKDCLFGSLFQGLLFKPEVGTSATK
jgi:hypothetical protein